MEGQDAHLSNTIWRRYAKRAFDTLSAVTLIIVLAPLFLLTAALVKCSSKGPVLFSQQRGGRDGRSFRLVKFRTMRGGRTPDAKERVPLDHADITRPGRFLRRFKIDELPQLFNVLTGSMSLIGPRPTLPNQVAAYDAFRRQRLLLRPGITGLAQVNCNALASWDERILYDIAYVRRCDLWLDLSIVARTVAAVVLGEDRTTRPFRDSPYAAIVAPPPGYGD